ncbi:hypothetical protein L2E82_31939 [Cichorium intybus]|uniref:Uncharacterized protein n=1 Tax=Cichorium intybus TaxID=13427 RepID=A0ACB9BIW9_CICIN|nr:hypothetical protein L2E82_31939 [Cichorium intybus]
MASEEIALVLSHRPDNHIPQLLFQDESNLTFRCNPPQQHLRHHPTGHTTNTSNSKTTRELTGFIEHQNRHYQPQVTTEFRRSMCDAVPAYHRGIQDWNGRNGRASSSLSGDGSDSDDGNEDDEDDMEDEDGDGDGHVVGLVDSIDSIKNAHKTNVSGHISGEKNGNGKRNHLSSIGNDIDDARASSNENHQQGQLCQYQNAITIADPTGELYYSQYLQGVEGSGPGFKDMLIENGCGFSGRKDVSNSGGSGESLRAILSDPLTGALMDDAMILPCGHSFGSGGMQHVMRMKACYTCSHPVSEGSVASNLSLRSAVHAFRREEELQTHRASKRRNRFDQDNSNYGDLALVDQSRCRGVQFPFVVTDRVIIKGNKRTPPRFVGREAVVTTQCLNGWYVVKTLDNAESVKLQYRSLAKVPDNQHSNQTSTKITTPNWL